MGCKLKDLFGFIIHWFLSASTLLFKNWSWRNCCFELNIELLSYLFLTPHFVIRKNLYNFKNFSQYTTICFVSLYFIRFSMSILGTYVPWWRWWDSNPWPPACRAGALPAELHPHFSWVGSFFTFFHFRFCGNITFDSSKISLAEGKYHFCEAKISLRTLVRHGRPKWTRTTDLVLIRHAL